MIHRPAVECVACGGGVFIETWLGIRCDGCGLVRRDVSHAYDGDFFTRTTDRYYNAYATRAAQWRHEANLRLDWLLEHRQTRRVIEVGSAAGFFVEQARKRGIDCWGIEPSQDIAAWARSELDVPVLSSTFEEARVARADCVCAWHVLEHVPDPLAFLAKARGVLAGSPLPGLALEVPNLASRAAQKRGRGWHSLMLDHHIWHFSPSNLQLLLERAGFLVLTVETLSPLTLSRRNLDGLRMLRRRMSDGGGDYVRILAEPQ